MSTDAPTTHDASATGTRTDDAATDYTDTTACHGGRNDVADDEALPSAVGAVATAAVLFDAGVTYRLPNTVDEANQSVW